MGQTQVRIYILISFQQKTVLVLERFPDDK